MADTDVKRPGEAAAATRGQTPASIGATGGLDLTRFQQEVAEEIGLGPDALARLNPKAQQISQLETRSHSR